MKKLLTIFATFFKIGLFTFGGGYAMISLIESECVEKRKWLEHDDFMDMTIIAESTPGPISVNSSTYIGYLQAGIPGAIAASNTGLWIGVSGQVLHLPHSSDRPDLVCEGIDLPERIEVHEGGVIVKDALQEHSLWLRDPASPEQKRAPVLRRAPCV